MTPAQRMFHETIVRALQMVVNAYKRWIKDEISKDPEHHKSIENFDEDSAQK